MTFETWRWLIGSIWNDLFCGDMQGFKSHIRSESRDTHFYKDRKSPFRKVSFRDRPEGIQKDKIVRLR